MQYRFLSLLALAILPATSHAQRPNSTLPVNDNRWQPIHEAERGPLQPHILLDTHTIVRDGNLVTVWMSYLFPSPQNSALGDNFTSMLSHVTQDCAKRRVKLLSFTTYTADGSVSKTNTIEEALQSYDDVAPGTLGEATLDAVCKR